MNYNDVDDYRLRYPGLPLKIVRFFSISNANRTSSGTQPKSIQDFIEVYQSENPSLTMLPQPNVINTICQKFVNYRFISSADVRRGFNLDGVSNCYLGTGVENLDEMRLSRHLDCVAYGFPCIYDTYKPSILPIAHTDPNGRTSIGTSFVVGDNLLQTAAHCISDAKELCIRGVSAADLMAAEFFVSKDSLIDLGLIRFATSVFLDTPIINAGKSVLLQEVMAVGFPDVPGFHQALAAEKALVSSRLTAVRGSIASTPTEIWTHADLLLITARVRGGFSGGPILNEVGDYIGLVAREPIHKEVATNDDVSHRYDNLGYGVAIPSESIHQFLTDIAAGKSLFSEKTTKNGVSFTEFQE